MTTTVVDNQLDWDTWICGGCSRPSTLVELPAAGEWRTRMSEEIKSAVNRILVEYGPHEWIKIQPWLKQMTKNVADSIAPSKKYVRKYMEWDEFNVGDVIFITSKVRGIPRGWHIIKEKAQEGIVTQRYDGGEPGGRDIVWSAGDYCRRWYPQKTVPPRVYMEDWKSEREPHNV